LAKRAIEGNLQAGLHCRGDGSHIGTGALNRGDKAHDQIGPAVIVAGNPQGRASLLTREIGERKSGENDAAEQKHSASRLDEISIRIKIWLGSEPLKPHSDLRDSGHWEFAARCNLDQVMHPRVGRNAATVEFG
jgi:hypothetical protein